MISALIEVEISNTANIFAGQKEIKNQVAHYFSNLGTLNYASQDLKRSFELPLIINYILSIVMMITSSYYTVEFIHDRIAVVFLWEIIDVLQFFVRFCLICNTVDNLCKLVSKFLSKANFLHSEFALKKENFERSQGVSFIPILRKFRDGQCKENDAAASTVSARIMVMIVTVFQAVNVYNFISKLILFLKQTTNIVIEICRSAKELDKYKLAGMIPVSKQLLLPVKYLVYFSLL